MSNETWLERCMAAESENKRLVGEVERLRGIVQADLEEKAEAWGEVEAHKRSRQIDANEARSREFVLRALLREWLVFANDVVASDAAGHDWAEGLRLRTRAVTSPLPAHPEAFLDDGFGNVWQKCQPFDKCRMQIVRPGKMQCDCTDHKSEAAQK